jgi:radical S-adenosyl methionine domain-containing protein 2
MAYETVVNLHVTERCNYGCTFCFGKWGVGSTEHELFEDAARAGVLIRDVADAVAARDGAECSVRFNFVGGEPALLRSLPKLIGYCKALGTRVSFVSNGLMLQRFQPAWIARQVDIAGLSIDSAVHATNLAIGRATRSGRPFHLESILASLAELRRLGATRVKINTVVSRANVGEDLSPVIREIRPDKWKVLQVLPVYGSTDTVSAAEFAAFVRRHAEFDDILVHEDNHAMADSYLMIDPLGRFFWKDSTDGSGYQYSAPVLEVGASTALRACPISWERYADRYRGVTIQV